jgi:hypothetical protein
MLFLLTIYAQRNCLEGVIKGKALLVVSLSTDEQREDFNRSQEHDLAVLNLQ